MGTASSIMDAQATNDDMNDFVIDSPIRQLSDHVDMSLDDEGEGSQHPPEVVDLQNDDEQDTANEPATNTEVTIADPNDDGCVQYMETRLADDDVLEVSSPRGKKRKRERKHKALKMDEVNTIDRVIQNQPTDCTICYESCTVLGRHRLVALKCGHTFGKKCIERWIADRKQCPNCNMPVRKKDILPLFSHHIAVVDNSGVEGVRTQLEDERQKRIQAETNYSRLQLQCQVKDSKIEQVEKEAAEWKDKFMALQCRIASDKFTAEPALDLTGEEEPPTQMTHESERTEDNWKYKELFRMPLKAGRVMELSHTNSFLCVADLKANSNTQHELHKISTLDPNHKIVVRNLHSSQIRDIDLQRLSSNEETLACTTSFDRQLIVSDLREGQMTAKFELPTTMKKGWSCCFSRSNEYMVYAGGDGTIAQFDLRKPGVYNYSNVVQSFRLQETLQPIQSLYSVCVDNVDKLIASSFNRLGVFHPDQGTQVQAALDRNVSPFVSMTGCPSNPGTILASTRTGREESAKHLIYDLTRSKQLEECYLHSFDGHRTPQDMTRAAVYADSKGLLRVIGGDDRDKGMVKVWGQDGACSERVMDCKSVLDVKHQVTNGDWSQGAMCGVLAKREVVLLQSRE